MCRNIPVHKFAGDTFSALTFSCSWDEPVEADPNPKKVSRSSFHLDLPGVDCGSKPRSSAAKGSTEDEEILNGGRRIQSPTASRQGPSMLYSVTQDIKTTGFSTWMIS